MILPSHEEIIDLRKIYDRYLDRIRDIWFLYQDGILKIPKYIEEMIVKALSMHPKTEKEIKKSIDFMEEILKELSKNGIVIEDGEIAYIKVFTWHRRKK